MLISVKVRLRDDHEFCYFGKILENFLIVK